ncbi:MAG: hypothetical protein ACYC9O_00140, partial [Candidatus Latescibacterota bacterium]
MRIFAAALLILTVSWGCSPAPRYTVHPSGGKPPVPPGANTAASRADSTGVSLPDKPKAGTKIRGVASYYADQYHGRKTANGEVFDMY